MSSGTDIPMSLLGKPSDDTDVVALLQQGGAKPPKLKRGEVNDWVELKPIGAQLVFADEAYQTSSDSMARGEGALLLSGVLFFPEGYLDYDGFDGVLPLGLVFSQSQAVTRAKLGEPEWKNPALRADRWVVDGVQVRVQYDESLDAIETVSMALPMPS